MAGHSAQKISCDICQAFEISIQHKKVTVIALKLTLTFSQKFHFWRFSS